MSGRGQNSGRGKTTGNGKRTGGKGITKFSCKLCVSEILGRNLKAHIGNSHGHFIKFRAHKYKTSLDIAKNDTYKNHINPGFKWPQDLLLEYQEQVESGTLTKFITKEGKKEERIPDNEQDVDMKSKDEILEEKNYKENLDENEEQPEKVIDVEQNEPNILEIATQIDDSLDNEVIQGEKVSTENIGNIASTDTCKIDEVCGEDIPNKKRSKKKIQTLLFPDTCATCVRIETLFEFAQKQLLDAVNTCSKDVLECTHKNEDECCCKEKLKYILEQVKNIKDVSGEEDENDENIKQDKESKIRENFVYKERLNKKKKERVWFCTVCKEYNKSIGKNDKKARGDWHFKGVCKQKSHLLVDGMKKHLNSAAHKKYKRKEMDEMERGKTFSVLSNEMAKKTTQNLCITSQFSATHNLTQRFHTKMCHFLHTLNENLGPNIQAKVHPLGNVHHGTMDAKEGMKACYLATQDRIRDEDQTVFPPTKMLQRYVLCYDKGTAVKDSQRQPVVATKINHKTGMPHEILVAASVVPKGNSEAVLEHITTETKKLLTTKNIAFTCSDNEPVYVGNKSGVGQRMIQDDNYSPYVIHLEDASHNAEKITTPPQKKYEDQLKEEVWVFETIASAKSLIGTVLSHPKMTKILRKYSDDQIEPGVNFYVFQPIMNVRFSEYMSRSINSILKNLLIMIKVLPDIASEDSMHDVITKEVATKVLQTIQDPVFIARLFLLDKVFFHISVLEKEAQSVTFGPFDFVRIKENLKKELEQMKYIDVKTIETIVEKGELKFEYNFRKVKKINHINLNDINLPEKSKRSSTIKKGNEVFDKFLKWIEHLLLRLEDYFKIPECMKLALNIFSISDELTNEEIDEKLINLKLFFPIVNTEYEKCGENCQGLDCNCLENQLRRFLDSVLERKNKIDEEAKSKQKVTKSKQKVKKKNIDYSEFYSFYLCEKNIETVKELEITNILRALELTMLMKASQSSTERVVSQIKKTVANRFENVVRWGKVLDFDMVNINVFLRMNSSIDTMNSELASKKYTEVLKHRPSIKKSKPLTDISITLKRLLKKNNETLDSKKPKPTMKPVKLVPSSSWEKKSKTSKTDIKQGTNNTEQNLNKENQESLPLKTDPDIEIAKISKNQSTDSTLPSKVCIDDCKKPKDDTYKWIGCKNNEYKCESYLKGRNEGYKDGDWFHSSCLFIESKDVETKDFICSLCEKAESQSKSNIVISEKSSTATFKVKMQSKLNFSQQDKKHISNVKGLNELATATLKPELNKSVIEVKELNKTARTNLCKELAKENRKIYRVPGNGDCLFSSISQCRTLSSSGHRTVRELFCDKFASIFKKFPGRWSYDTRPKGDELKDPELYFVSKVVKQCLDDEDIFNKQSYEELTEEDVKSYLMTRKIPCSHGASKKYSDMKNWGNSLDIHLIALVYGVNVYYLQECTDSNGINFDYRLHFWSQYESLEFVPYEKNIEREYIMILFENSVKHYSPIIISNEEKDMPEPICCRSYLSGIVNCCHKSEKKEMPNNPGKSSKRHIIPEPSADEQPCKSIKLEPEDN